MPTTVRSTIEAHALPFDRYLGPIVLLLAPLQLILTWLTMLRPVITCVRVGGAAPKQQSALSQDPPLWLVLWSNKLKYH